MSRVKITKEIQIHICEELERGKTLQEICRPETMPSIDGVLKLVRTSEEFKKEYHAARVLQMHYWIDSLMELSKADNLPKPAEIEAMIGSDNTTFIKSAMNAEMTRRRMEMDAIKFMAAKLAPNLYPEEFGVKSQVNVTGELTNTIQVVNYAALEKDVTNSSRVLDMTLSPKTELGITINQIESTEGEE